MAPKTLSQVAPAHLVGSTGRIKRVSPNRRLSNAQNQLATRGLGAAAIIALVFMVMGAIGQLLLSAGALAGLLALLKVVW